MSVCLKLSNKQIIEDAQAKRYTAFILAKPRFTNKIDKIEKTEIINNLKLEILLYISNALKAFI